MRNRRFVQEPQSMEHATDSAEFKASGCFSACRLRSPDIS